mmetsp:Transcript_120746/g.352641  ORF Transcript_120746/g.352641 Transcript_120746/m.352641 type:complete len:208 (+) Transcript_120746:18-641(+)
MLDSQAYLHNRSGRPLAVSPQSGRDLRDQGLLVALRDDLSRELLLLPVLRGGQLLPGHDPGGGAAILQQGAEEHPLAAGAVEELHVEDRFELRGQRAPQLVALVAFAAQARVQQHQLDLAAELLAELRHGRQLPCAWGNDHEELAACLCDGPLEAFGAAAAAKGGALPAAAAEGEQAASVLAGLEDLLRVPREGTVPEHDAEPVLHV